jgi:exopolysaccharide/PEP-CTERM locus tyrosine autokinase
MEKFAKEGGKAKTGSNAIRKSYYHALMQFDETTGKIKVDGPETGGVSTRFKSLVTYGLVRADGSLTPAGKAKYREMKSPPEKRKPSGPAGSLGGRVKKEVRPKTPVKNIARLTASDLAILLKYDRNTGNLLKYDPRTERLDRDSIALLRNPAVIQRFIDNNFIMPGGWLTPQAKEECARIEEKLRQKKAKQSGATPAPAKPVMPPVAERPLRPSIERLQLSSTDMEALSDFNSVTLKLNKGNPLIHKDPNIIKRLLESGMIAADGKLTARGLVATRITKLQRRKPEAETTFRKQNEPAAENPAATEDKKQTPPRIEAPPKSSLKIIHLKKEAQKLKPAAKEPQNKVDAPAPAVKAGGKTAAAPAKTPVPGGPHKAAQAGAAVAGPQMPVQKSPAAKRIAKPPGTPAKLPEAAADTVPGKPQTAPAVAVQGFNRNAIDRNLVSLLDPQSFEAEQFKILRTNLLFPESGRSPRLVMVTSALPGEGKSFVAANLAVSVARHVNWNVLLMDCDLRRPSIHRQFGYQQSPGLSDYLSDGISLKPLLLKTEVENLTILPAGRPPHNPSELLSSDRMSALLKEVATRYNDRLIIIDSPPPRMSAESAALARQVDGIVLVVKYASTSLNLIHDLIDKFGKDKIVGALINSFEARSSYYKSQYYGQYSPAHSS